MHSEAMTVTWKVTYRRIVGLRQGPWVTSGVLVGIRVMSGEGWRGFFLKQSILGQIMDQTVGSPDPHSTLPPALTNQHPSTAVNQTREVMFFIIITVGDFCTERVGHSFPLCPE